MKDNISKINRREFFKKGFKGAGAMVAAGGALTALTGCPGPEEPPDASPCYPDYAPTPTAKSETELGKKDGIIYNLNTRWAIEISTSSNFSSGNFMLAPNSNRQGLSAGNYYARWAATGTCLADIKYVVPLTIEPGLDPTIPPPTEQEVIETCRDLAEGLVEKAQKGDFEVTMENGTKKKLADLMQENIGKHMRYSFDASSRYGANNTVEVRTYVRPTGEIYNITVESLADYNDEYPYLSRSTNQLEPGGWFKWNKIKIPFEEENNGIEPKTQVTQEMFAEMKKVLNSYYDSLESMRFKGLNVLTYNDINTHEIKNQSPYRATPQPILA